MRLLALLTAAMFSVIVASCDNPVEPSGGDDTCTETLLGRCWTFLGPDGMWITAMADTPWGLFVGTREDVRTPAGVHRFDSSSDTWHFVGLDHAMNASMLMVPGDTARLLVGMRPSGDMLTDAAVFATEDGGRTWNEWDGGLARKHDHRSWAYALAVDPGNPRRLLMGQSRAILRSEDGGRTWNFVLGTHGWAAHGIETIVVSPARDGRVWASSQSGAFDSAIIDRSHDWGETWEHSDEGRTLIYQFVTDPDDPHRLWRAEIGVVRRSEDGGTTWEMMPFIRNPPGAVTGLLLNDGHLFAASTETLAGADPDEFRLGLYESTDGGDSWEPVTVPKQAAGATPRNLTLGNDGALLIGTRSGVWRVTR